MEKLIILLTVCLMQSSFARSGVAGKGKAPGLEDQIELRCAVWPVSPHGPAGLRTGTVKGYLRGSALSVLRKPNQRHCECDNRLVIFYTSQSLQGFPKLDFTKGSEKRKCMKQCFATS